MKILVFADVHADLNALKDIHNLAKKEKPDLMICAGDISFFGSGLYSVISRLNIRVPLFIIPGNHETAEQIENAEKRFPFVRNIHLKLLKKDFIIFFGCGGSGVTPNNTPFELTETEFKNMLSIFKTKNNENKLIFVIHEPPFNTRLDFIGNHAGSKEVRKFIEEYQPLYCICGHFHENEGKEDRIGRTTIINPGPEGKIIEI